MLVALLLLRGLPTEVDVFALVATGAAPIGVAVVVAEMITGNGVATSVASGAPGTSCPCRAAFPGSVQVHLDQGPSEADPGGECFRR